MTHNANLNSARYCDGQSRQHTVRFPGAGVRGTDLFAAIAGQTCSDPLDCVALTEAEAVAAGEAWARNRTTMLATDLRTMFEVIPLPAGWNNDGAGSKSPGQLAYEADCAIQPTYHDGQPRKAWSALCPATRDTWHRNPTTKPRTAMVAQPVQQAQCKALCAAHSHYNRTNFPRVIGQHGNWDICANAEGYCAAIPNRRGEAFGCHATHFGDADYVRVTLGLEAMPVAMVPQPCQQQQGRAYAVTLYVEVTDEAAALEAGAQELVDTNSVEDIEQARAEIGGDVSKALRFILDPGADLDRPWLQINDSSCDPADCA